MSASISLTGGKIANMSMDEVRAELRVWQQRGLDGVPRSDADKDRIVALWARIDAPHKAQHSRARA